MRVKPHGCWNKIILEKPFEHPHFLKNKLSHEGKRLSNTKGNNKSVINLESNVRNIRTKV